jgi:hypothetical protein
LTEEQKFHPIGSSFREPSALRPSEESTDTIEFIFLSEMTIAIKSVTAEIKLSRLQVDKAGTSSH